MSKTPSIRKRVNSLRAENDLANQVATPLVSAAHDATSAMKLMGAVKRPKFSVTSTQKNSSQPFYMVNMDNVKNDTLKPVPELEKEKQTLQEFYNQRSLQIVQRFCRETTAHGWGRVVRERSHVFKVVWVCLTLTAFSMNVYHVVELVNQYLRYPSEQISQVQYEQINFPSVTLCNIQPMSLTTSQAYAQNQSTLYYRWDNITLEYLAEVASSLNRSDEFETLYNRLRQPTGFFENIGHEAQEIGHQSHDFLLDCTFGLEHCDFENFTYFQSPTYYNCFTFNGGNLSKENLIARSTGPQEGLSLIMYLESDNGDFLYNGTYYTFSKTGNAAGVRVVIHPPGTRPSPIDNGFDVSPGYSSSVGVKVLQQERLGEPFGPCVDDRMKGSDRYIYATSTCLLECQQKHVVDSCSCVSSSLPIPEALTDTPFCAYCGCYDEASADHFFNNISCETDKIKEFSENENLRTACNCHPPCEETAYHTDISLSYWPLDYTQASFFKTYVLEHPDYEHLKAYQNLGPHNFNISDIIFYGLIRKNFVRLNIYLKDLVIEETVQQQSYEIQNLFSDVGGTFGLWIGMSVITWCEVLELLTNLFSRWFRKMMGWGNLNDAASSTKFSVTGQEFEAEFATFSATVYNDPAPSYDSTKFYSLNLY
jgi:hypothetical protein